MIKLLLSTWAALCLTVPVWAAQWQPAKAPLMTRWAKDVSPENALPEYPRPQLERAQWLNLNGLWNFAVTRRGDTAPENFTQKILVPFPAESALSGVMTNITDNDRLWYQRTFRVPATWKAARVILHFGAVDFEATVRINGKEVGNHRGGYDPFNFDITDALKDSGENELLVSVYDPTDASPNSRGKQVRKPDRGIFYTATSGIWQTVWIEAVPENGILALKILPDLDAKTVRIDAVRQTPRIAGQARPLSIEAVAMDGNTEVARARVKDGEPLVLNLPAPKTWSPENPFLYNLAVMVKEPGKTVDTVQSYFGMRKVALAKDDTGVTRIFLNNKPYFMVGPLDQGFWPDGLYTAPTDQALRYDIEVTKQLGFNMARKHVKVEPERWYYWCDKLGLIVWQDMPSGDRFISPTQPDIKRTPESAKEFETELKA